MQPFSAEEASASAAQGVGPRAADAELEFGLVLCALASHPTRVRSVHISLRERALRIGSHEIALSGNTPVLCIRVDGHDARQVLVIPVGGERGGFAVLALETAALSHALARVACVLPLALTLRDLAPLGLVPPADLLPSDRLSSRVHRTCRLLQSATLLCATATSGVVLRLADTVGPQAQLRDSPLLEARLTGVREAVRSVSTLSLGAAAMVVDGTLRLADVAGCAFQRLGGGRALGAIHRRIASGGASREPAGAVAPVDAPLEPSAAPAAGAAAGAAAGEDDELAAAGVDRPRLAAAGVDAGHVGESAHAPPLRAEASSGALVVSPAAPPVVQSAAQPAGPARVRLPVRHRLRRALPTLHHCLGALMSTLGAFSQAKDVLSTSLKQAAVRAAHAAYGPVGGRVTEHGWDVMAAVQRVPARPSSVALLVVSAGLGRIAQGRASGGLLGSLARPRPLEPRLLGIVSHTGVGCAPKASMQQAADERTPRAGEGSAGSQAEQSDPSSSRDRPRDVQGQAMPPGEAEAEAEAEEQAEAQAEAVALCMAAGLGSDSDYAILGRPLHEGRLAQWIESEPRPPPGAADGGPGAPRPEAAPSDAASAAGRRARGRWQRSWCSVYEEGLSLVDLPHMPRALASSAPGGAAFDGAGSTELGSMCTICWPQLVTVAFATAAGAEPVPVRPHASSARAGASSSAEGGGKLFDDAEQLPSSEQRGPPSAEFTLYYRSPCGPLGAEEVRSHRLCATSAAAAGVWVGLLLRLPSLGACASLVGEAHHEPGPEARAELFARSPEPSPRPPMEHSEHPARPGRLETGANLAAPLPSHGAGEGHGGGSCGSSPCTTPSCDPVSSSWELIAVDDELEEATRHQQHQ